MSWDRHTAGGLPSGVALDYPERVRSLVLAATGPGQIDPEFEPTRGIPAHVVEAMVEKGYERYMQEHLGGDFFFLAGISNEASRGSIRTCSTLS